MTFATIMCHLWLGASFYPGKQSFITWLHVNSHMVNMLRALVKDCGIHPINDHIVPVHAHTNTHRHTH